MAYECSAFRQCPRQGIHPSKYCSYLPPPPTSGRGPGTWFRGHAPHLKDRGNAYGNTVTALPAGTAAEAGEPRRADEMQEERSAGRQMLHVIIKQAKTIELSALNVCCLLYFDYTAIKLERREKESWPVACDLRSAPLACSSGKQVLMRKFN